LTVPAAELAAVEPKKNTVLLTFRPGSKLTAFALGTKPEPLDPLIAALTPIFALPRTETRFLALRVILPSFKFSDRAQTNALHKGIIGQTSQFLQQFCSSAGSIAVNGSLVDVFSCVFRMRYRNESAQPTDASVKALGQEFRRHLIVVWCQSIIKCLQPSASPSEKAFYSQLAVNAASTVSKASSRLDLECEDLVSAAAAFAEYGSREGLEVAAARIAKEAQDGIDKELGKVHPFDAQNLPLLMTMAIAVLSGIAAGMYSVDIDLLAEKAVEFTQALLTRQQIDAARKDLIQTHNGFLRDMVCRLDGQRYDEPFQFIFCIWEMRIQGES
jgi:hypothetical protein